MFAGIALSINELVYLIGNYLDIKDRIVFYCLLNVTPSFDDILNLVNENNNLIKKCKDYVNTIKTSKTIKCIHCYVTISQEGYYKQCGYCHNYFCVRCSDQLFEECSTCDGSYCMYCIHKYINR